MSSTTFQSPREIIDHFSFARDFNPREVVESFDNLSADRMALVVGQLSHADLTGQKEETFQTLVDRLRKKVEHLPADSIVYPIASACLKFIDSK